MFNKIKKWVQVGAAGMMIGTGAMEDTAKADVPAIEDSATPGIKKEEGSMINPDAAKEILKMMKAPNDIKWNKKYSRDQKVQLLREVSEKYFLVSGAYHVLNGGALHDSGEIKKLRDSFLTLYPEYVQLVKDIEAGNITSDPVSDMQVALPEVADVKYNQKYSVNEKSHLMHLLGDMRFNIKDLRSAVKQQSKPENQKLLIETVHRENARYLQMVKDVEAGTYVVEFK